MNTSASSDRQVKRASAAVGHINAFWLTIPDIDTASAKALGLKATDIDIDQAGGRHDAGLVAGHGVAEALALSSA
jgi:hypothetical protein